MPSPAHTRVTFSGIFGTEISPVEIWSVNINTEPLEFTTVAAAKAAATACRTAWVDNMAPLMTTDLILTRTRVAVINGLGHVAQEQDGTYQQGDETLPKAGVVAAQAASRHPTQVALVGSLVTPRPGPTGKGRVFLPFQSNYALEDDYRLSQGAATTFATALKGLVNGVAAGTGQPVVVASSKGYLSPVTAVRVGRVLDTMRSRRNAMLESYSAVSLTG